MNKYVLRGLYLTLAVGGLTLLGATAANAADNTTSGQDGLVSGTQAGLGLQLPITASGNAVSLLGDSNSSNSAVSAPAAPAAPASSGATSSGAPSSGTTTSGRGGVASGSQALVGASAPVTVSGNSISVLGDSHSSGATASSPAAPEPTAPVAPATTTGGSSVLGGTQGLLGLAAPVNAGGNAVSVLGDSTSSGSSTTGSNSTGSGTGTSGTGTNGPTTTGRRSLLGGTQVLGSIGAPVTVGGNAITAVGDPMTSGSTVAGGTAAGAGVPITTSGQGGILGGSQLIPVLGVPVTLGGNAITVVGDPTTSGSTTGTPGGPGTPGNPGGPGTPGNSGTPVTSTGSVTTTGNGGVTTAALGSSVLAFTGFEVSPFAGATLLLMLAGLVLMVAARRKSATIE